MKKAIVFKKTAETEMVIYSFIFFLLLFVLIGVLSTLRSRANNKDYLMAGQNVAPWLAGLSAVATNNSGYMFIGMIGYTYMSGVQSLWVLFAWLAGDYLIGCFAHRKIREVAENKNILSFGGLLSNWNGADYKKLKILVGVLTFIFLGTYAAAQLKAGSKALFVLFGWDYSVGAIIGSIIVFSYCIAGGIRASIWTDAAQSITMIIAMGLLCFIGINENGGWIMFWQKLHQISPGYLNFFPDDLLMNNGLGMFLFALGWFFGGLGVIGQPHIMVRFMTVDKPEHIRATRTYYYFWYLIFCIFTFIVGLTARLVFPDISVFDQELALPMMGQKLLPEILVGVVLAGIFAATMSTADSQILSCSAALSKDILPKTGNNIWVTKISTAIITLIALIIALFGGKNVFNLVLMSWSVLAAAFAPLLFIYSINKKVNEFTGLSMVIIGVSTTILWRSLGLGAFFYEIAPGMIAGVATFYISNLFGWNNNK